MHTKNYIDKNYNLYLFTNIEGRNSQLKWFQKYTFSHPQTEELTLY